jgi:hypothetical protein
MVLTKLTGDQLMEPDELKARGYRKEKIATAKSPKKDAVKVDAVKVKGLPGGGLFDIGVYIFFRPHRVSIYVVGTILTPNPITTLFTCI